MATKVSRVTPILAHVVAIGCCPWLICRQSYKAACRHSRNVGLLVNFIALTFTDDNITILKKKVELFPDRWEVGPYFAHHLASCTPLHPYVTLHFEMLLFHFLPIWTLKPHILMLEGGKKYMPFYYTSYRPVHLNLKVLGPLLNQICP